MSSTDTSSPVDQVPTDLFIAGGWHRSGSGSRFDVENPATGEAIARVADATPQDGEAALDAAVTAQTDWATIPPRERAEILRRAFDIITDRRDEIAHVITAEMGKPLAEAHAEVAYGAEFFRWFSEEAARIAGHYAVSPNGSGRMLTMKQPVGPCLLITPWNFPLAMGTRKIGPAVAAGCTMVVKPAQQTPLTMLLLADIMADCGLPPGVLNVVPTSQAGSVMGPLIRDGRARKLSFTGSTPVGRTLIAQAAEQVLRVSMELGGNAPFLVFEDADLDAAVDGAVVAKMRNIGESCIAANRFLVAEEIANDFARRFTERLEKLTVGPGTQEGVDVGPLIDERARQDVQLLVDEARAGGARALTGGEIEPGGGYFYPPTVLCDVPPEARILREEIFGPVAPISTFSNEQEAVARANDTEYGLVAYVYTSDVKRALRICEDLEVGMVGLNRGLISNAAAPFGGVKQSGLGREGSQAGIEEYLETKYVAVDL